MTIKVRSFADLSICVTGNQHLAVCSFSHNVFIHLILVTELHTLGLFLSSPCQGFGLKKSNEMHKDSSRKRPYYLGSLLLEAFE